MAHSADSGTEMKRLMGFPPRSVSGKLSGGGVSAASASEVATPIAAAGPTAWGMMTVMGSEKSGPRDGSRESIACTLTK